MSTMTATGYTMEVETCWGENEDAYPFEAEGQRAFRDPFILREAARVMVSGRPDPEHPTVMACTIYDPTGAVWKRVERPIRRDRRPAYRRW